MNNDVNYYWLYTLRNCCRFNRRKEPFFNQIFIILHIERNTFARAFRRLFTNVQYIIILCRIKVFFFIINDAHAIGVNLLLLKK